MSMAPTTLDDEGHRIVPLAFGGKLIFNVEFYTHPNYQQNMTFSDIQRFGKFAFHLPVLRKLLETLQ